MNRSKRAWILVQATMVATMLVSAPAMAYVGPGAGLSLLSALWGLIAAVGIALGFVLFWPIRRWRRRRAAALDDAMDGLDMELEEAPELDHRRRMTDGD